MFNNAQYYHLHSGILRTRDDQIVIERMEVEIKHWASVA